jgi:hypothetical protein
MKNKKPLGDVSIHVRQTTTARYTMRCEGAGWAEIRVVQDGVHIKGGNISMIMGFSRSTVPSGGRQLLTMILYLILTGRC